MISIPYESWWEENGWVYNRHDGHYDHKAADVSHHPEKGWTVVGEYDTYVGAYPKSAKDLMLLVRLFTPPE